MADIHAIGAVSRSLQNLLSDRMDKPNDIASFDVTVGLPSPLAEDDGPEPARLNLFLYMVLENEFLQNHDPSAHPGDPGRPPLSLDLYYLVTGFGTVNETSGTTTAQTEVIAHYLLGSAMRVLYDYPVITSDLEDDAGERILEKSLRDDVELVKVTLDPLGLDELSKIWMGLGEPMRVSAAYAVRMALIESQGPRRQSPPVTERRIHVGRLRRPTITRVYRRPSAGELEGDGHLAIGEILRIEGENFVAAETWVVLERLDPIKVTPTSATRIELTVPDATYPDSGDPIAEDQLLQAGVRSVRVVVAADSEAVVGGALDKGDVVDGQSVMSSNSGVFQIVPTVTNVDPPDDLGSPAVLAVEGTRLFAPGLSSDVIVGDLSIPVQPMDPDAAPPDPWADPTSTRVEVSLAALRHDPVPLAKGVYSVRVQVNGALSRETTQTFEVTS
ncbi:MAG: DUF4255 domain-containing protein [Planctomycetota bacterium]